MPELGTIIGLISGKTKALSSAIGNKASEADLEELANNGSIQKGEGVSYYTLLSGQVNSSTTVTVEQNIIASNNTGYILIPKAQVPSAIYFDDTKYKVNVAFAKNDYIITGTYSAWKTTSPIEYTEPSDWDTLIINVRKLSGNMASADLTSAMYKDTLVVLGNLATKNFVASYFSKAAKCIYPDGFTSRIKPNIFNNGRYSADINLDDYKISGTGEVWVATNGNDTTGTGTEEKPYATITKALTASAATIHIKAGTYTQGTHYSTTADFAGKNIIGHGNVVLQNDSPGHYAKVTSSAYIEGIIFKHGNSTTNSAFYASCTASGKTVCLVRCTFCDSGANGLKLEGIDAVVVECVAYGNALDGFNYHAKTVENTTYIPNVLEIDCVAYNNGSNASGSDSCNGSTAHDGVQIIRLNGEYYSCYGGVIAEIGGTGDGDPTTKSVNFGVLAHESTGTGTYNASFWVSYNTVMYLYDCKSFGSTYDISAINDGKVVSWRLTTGSDNPSKNTGASATVIEH